MSQSIILQRKAGLFSRSMALFSYMGVLCLIPMMTSRDDTYVRFHARQGAILWMWEVLAVYTLLMPGFGKLFFKFSSMACLILSIIGILSVLVGRAWKFPLIGEWAEKL
ncbi:MAG: hypothetical protein HQL94_05675 [Magnetococcales bacterium]|nr:hypothetical protein [Magnetococcales bacterium]MBF0437856.1 hypothetical protein [Magnetococcales bacterium]